jgi:hypothetical protein
LLLHDARVGFADDIAGQIDLPQILRLNRGRIPGSPIFQRKKGGIRQRARNQGLRR